MYTCRCVLYQSTSCFFTFKDVTSAQHPIIVLPYACYQDLLAVISFMYKGEINITQGELPGLLTCAESLQVKGLAKINPLKASGLLQEVCQQSNGGNNTSHQLGAAHFRMEPSRRIRKNGSGFISYGEDEEAVEITEILEEKDEHLVVDEGKICLLFIAFFRV